MNTRELIFYKLKGRRILKTILLVILFFIPIVLTDCKKEDPEKVRRENYTSLLLADINADSLKSNAIWLQNMGTRFALADNHHQVALKIRRKFEQLGYADAKLDSFHIIRTYKNVVYDQMQYNVILTIPGTEYTDSLCVIGAHYDDILSSGDPFTSGSGANDNASGVAGILEIARAIKKEDFKPESTVKLIAFGAEELGLLGSYDYAASPQNFGNAIRFMLNFDMISTEVHDPSAWYVNILDYDNSHGLRKDAEELGSRYTTLHTINNNAYNNRSDSYPFFVKGYKALFFFSNDTDQNYHTLNDLASNCNFAYSREIVKLATALLISKN